MELPPIFIMIGSYFAMAGGVWTLFDRADKAIKDETRKSISRWLTETNPNEENSKWPGQFIKIFDSVFGEKHLSWRCFLRSSVASYIAIFILSLVHLSIRGIGELFSLNGEFDSFWILSLFSFGAMLNLLPDYVSLLETRYILGWISCSKSFLKTFSLLCLDLSISSLLFIGGLVLLIYIFFLVDPTFTRSIHHELASGLTDLKSGLSFEHYLGILFYSTFFTSVWIWLYVLSGLTIKIYHKAGRGFKWLNRFLDFKNKPLPALGFMSNLIILFLYLIGFGLFYDGSFL